MIKIKDAATETALCTGVILALLWGIGVSVRGLLQEPGSITWADWFVQLVLGKVVALTMPLLLVRATDWVTRRVEAVRRRPSGVPQV